MDAVASDWLAIGSDLYRSGLLPAAVLCLRALRLRFGIDLQVQIQSSLSLKINAWPTETPDATRPRGRGI